MFIRLLLISFFFLCFNAYCGERGYYLFVSGNDEGKEIYQSYRKESEIYGESKSCWAKRTGSEISISYVKNIPEGITSQLIEDAINDKYSSLGILRHKLSSFHDDQISHGFDAMIYIEKHNGNAVLTLIPLEGKIATETVRSIDFQSLDLGLCKVLSVVDKYYSP